MILCPRLPLPPKWRAQGGGQDPKTRFQGPTDHGYTDAAANPSKFPTGMFSIGTGSYDYQTTFMEADAVYTNKPPGG